jgi:hypothetical protein
MLVKASVDVCNDAEVWQITISALRFVHSPVIWAMSPG